MSPFGLFLLILILLIIPAAAIIYVLLARRRAQRAGLPPPSFTSFIPFRNQGRSQSSSARSGPLGWFRSKFHSLKDATSGGGYQQPLGGRGRRGLDPDEAWDARVGNEADAYGPGGYYEEQELGLRPGAPGEGSYAGGGYGVHGTVLPEYGAEEMVRGRSRSRDPGPGYIGGSQGGLDHRYDEQMRRDDPFGDGAERSELRGVSPRPVGEEDEGKKHAQKDSLGGHGDSPTERRSMFHENM